VRLRLGRLSVRKDPPVAAGEMPGKHRPEVVAALAARAHIVVVTHAFDGFRTGDYLLRTLAGYWADAGHQVSVAAGIDNLPPADIAILHVNLSVLPAAYIEACRRYPVVVNGAAVDIRKTRVSRQLVRPGDQWAGRVIVKTDLNHGGTPEMRLGELAQLHGRPCDLPAEEPVDWEEPYPVFRSAGEVPDDVWDNPGLVVERFLPEEDARGFWMRVWDFCGDRERCTRFLGGDPVVKRTGSLERHPCPVPEEIRAERRRLGFDYGKFDFVVHEGEPLLLDANRTPWAPPRPWTAELEASNADLARGIEAFLQ